MAMSSHFPVPPNPTNFPCNGGVGVRTFFLLRRPSPFPMSPLADNKALSRKRELQILTTRALGEWREYEDAVKEKDLARALRFLKDIPIQRTQNSSIESTRSPGAELSWISWERDWEVLDTCLNADDMRLVGAAYSFLKARGFLPNFGKCRNIGNPSSHIWGF